MISKRFSFLLLFIASCVYGVDISYDDYPMEVEMGAPLGEQNQRLEFSNTMNEYFEEELSLPGATLPSAAKPKIGAEAKVIVEALYLDEGKWSLIFTFPEPVTYKKTIDDDGLYLEFNQSIDSPDLLVAGEKVSNLIKRFGNGYNTINLIPRRSVSYSVEAKGHTFILDITPDLEGSTESTSFLDLAYARLLVEERHYSESRCAIDKLLEKLPDDKSVLLLQAGFEGILPNPQKQFRLLEDLKKDHPLDEDISLLYYDSYSLVASNVSTGCQLQQTVDFATIWFYPVEAEWVIAKRPFYTLYLGAECQFWRGKLDSIVNEQGLPDTFFGNRNQGNLFRRFKSEVRQMN